MNTAPENELLAALTRTFEIADPPSEPVVNMARLRAQEEIIAAGRASYWDVGRALKLVLDEGLFKATHKTWEAYVHERWEMKRQRSYEIMRAAEVADLLYEISDTDLVNEGQAAAAAELLKTMPAKSVARVLDVTVLLHGRLTAAAITEVGEAVRVVKPSAKATPATVARAVEKHRRDEERRAAEQAAAKAKAAADAQTAAAAIVDLLGGSSGVDVTVVNLARDTLATTGTASKPAKSKGAAPAATATGKAPTAAPAATSKAPALTVVAEPTETRPGEWNDRDYDELSTMLVHLMNLATRAPKPHGPALMALVTQAGDLATELKDVTVESKARQFEQERATQRAIRGALG